jgi:hypothetical protein
VQVARASWKLGDLAAVRREAEAVIAAVGVNPNASPGTVGEARLLLAHAAHASGRIPEARAHLTDARRLLAAERGSTLRRELEALAASLEPR